MWHAWKREKYMPTGFCLRKLNERKKLLDRPRGRWEGKIIIRLKEIGWCGVKCNDQPQDGVA
jgi:hypothetical protein